MKELWVEKYRPATLDGYVFRDANQRAEIESWIREGSIPHLLFSGGAGIGKTTLAKILIKALDINEYDILELNASAKNSVDEVRDTITNFVSTMPFGEFKIVLLDEADYLSPNAQAALRNLMETYSSSARFILTCNYPHKVIPALHSRCQGFHIAKTDQTEFTARVATVLVEEGIDFDLDTLDDYVKATYPDLRKCLNLVQASSVSGSLRKTDSADGSSADWKLDAVHLFKQRKIKQARQLLCSQATAEEMDDVFRWLYDNLELWGKTDEAQDQAIVVIRKGMVNHSMCADAEINLSATIVELAQIEA
jgi:DNA polymerase III delta prime subunit